MKKVLLALVLLGFEATSCNNERPAQSAAIFMTTQDFFNGYAAGLLTYSPETISSFYQVPLTVYSDQGIQHVSKMSEVEAFWQQGIKPYKKKDLKKSVPQIVSEDRLSEKITVCKVLWKNYDAGNKEVAQETNFYILTRTSEGLKISGLIIMAQKTSVTYWG